MRKVLILVSGVIFLFFGAMLSSCTKDGSWFPDKDCVTKEYEVIASLTPNVLPPSGGEVALVVEAQQITHFIQFDKEIKTESNDVDYTLAIKGNPDNFSLRYNGEVYVLSVPVNNRNMPITITLIVVAEGKTFEFDLIQEPKKYNVDVDLQ